MLESNFGISALVRLNGLALLLVGVTRLSSPRATGIGVGGGLISLASFLLVGHTAISEPRFLVLGANAAHTLAGAIWAGGLVLLGLTLHRRRATGDALGGAQMVARFSAIAVVVVAVVVIADAALAWVEVGSFRALTETTYGLTLLGKAALVAVLLAIGAYNNRRLVPGVQQGADDAWRTLGRTVRFEVTAMVAVLAATAVLVTLAPGRTALQERFTEDLALGSGKRVDLVVDPNRPGSNEVHVYLGQGTVPPADEPHALTLRFSLPQAGIAPIEREAVRAGPGHYLHAGTELSIPGTWHVEVAVRVSDFERLTAATDVNVRR